MIQNNEKKGNSLPSFESKREKGFRIEAINPDSLSDAFEVAEDEIERLFRSLKNW